MFAFVFLFLLMRVVCTHTCSRCQCCAQGLEKCTYRGDCKYGCIDGYYGNTCTDKCKPNCLSCIQNSGFCSKCKSGYYFNTYYCHDCGSQCQSCLPYGCDYCNDGYWGKTCKNRCPESCTSCQKSDGYCRSCDLGYYLYNGNCTTCVTHCANCALYGCNLCNDGHWGGICENSCTERCKSCTKESGNCLSCEAGYWGSTCDEFCVENCLECDRWNGNCNSCKSGNWGYSCTACGVQCKKCSQSYGCLECNDGYFGETCRKYCGLYCQTCDISYDCTDCLPGYYKHNNYCIQCHFKEYGCICTSNEQCSGCVDGYFLDPQMCSKCPDPCTSCTRSSLSGYIECKSCTSGRFGETCQYVCSRDCRNGICEEENAVCRCNQNYNGKSCDMCVSGRFGEKCDHVCSIGCKLGNCMNETGFCLCKTGWSGQRCDTCMDGYYGRHCDKTCPIFCQTCDINGLCLICKSGFSNLQNHCKCRRDKCVNERNCTSCKNTSFHFDNDVCCLCDLGECLSCSQINDTVICSICNAGFYPSKRGQCLECNANCIEQSCSSSSGKCLKGYNDGFWSDTCENGCDAECKSCRQLDGMCTKCINSSKHGPHCSLDCYTACKNVVCDINGNCLNGCDRNTYGKQCENACDEHCLSNGNNTICSEQTGMCLFGCKPGYRGDFCPEEVGKTNERHTSLSAALGGGISGGITLLIIIVIVGMFWFRKRRRSHTELDTLENNESLHDAQRDYDTVDTNLPEVELNDLRRRSNTEHNDSQNNDIVQDARRDYDIVDTNLREVELNDLRYETLEVNEVHTMDQTADYSSIPEQENDIIAYENVIGGL
ncbi:TENX-like protein [Mya arenaria]|uniref:TENX-like protein n=1 Tax=Mya arenaria TaxID=6604 RepID=A0ABY7F361_MYAAR|nr:TENX-like protein [Mya arenaria]